MTGSFFLLLDLWSRQALCKADLFMRAFARLMNLLLISKKRPMGVMMKIDMQKAYDRLDWSFLMAVLKKFGFSDSWCQILFSCISNCWYSVSVQGELNAFFKSHRGVRQVEQNVPDC